MKIDALPVEVYRVPTDRPEADGTFEWDATTMVIARPAAEGSEGLGYSYTTSAAAELIRDLLETVVVGSDPMDVQATWVRMVAAIRNVGRPGVASAAIAAVDIGLWDLKAKLLHLPLTTLLGAVRPAATIYGSGGFTSYSERELCEQLAGWVDSGITRVKMKIGTQRGTQEATDVARVCAARRAIADQAELFVDANGAYSAKQAVRLAHAFREQDVSWFEEPVSSDDLEGLRAIREQIDIEVAAGEYGADLPYFERMCAAGAVDVVQADVTRCAGITEWQRVAAVAAAHGLEISGHCAPTAHLAVACAAPNLRHLEYFHDHVRIEALLFDGVSQPCNGLLKANVDRPGLGIELRPDAVPYRVEEDTR